MEPVKANLRAQRAQQTKMKILTAAIEILGSDGQKGLSSQKVIERAGISKGTLYHHFSSMDDLLIAVMTFFCEGLSREISEHKFNSIGDFLNYLGEKTLTEIVQNEKLCMAFLSFYEKAIFDEKYRQIFKKQFESFFLFIETSIQEIDHHQIPKEKLKKLSMAVAFTCDSMGIYYHIFQDLKLFKDYWRFFSEMILSHLSPHLKGNPIWNL